MNSKFSRVFIGTLLIIFSAISTPISSTNSMINQERLDAYAPILLTGNGIRTFFSKTFNMTEFSQEIFPNDMSSFVQCLNYAQKKYQTRTHGKHVIRLFTSKLRDCTYVNASAFSSMLEDITPILQNYTQGISSKNFTLFQKKIDSMLCDAFVNRFASFKEKPVAFLHELSGSIVDALNDQEQITGDISLDEFRMAITQFFDMGLSKLVWHPEDGMQTWKLSKAISQQFSQLFEINVLNNEEVLQDLYDGLIKRYCFFLDLVNVDLPVGFFEEMKRELSAQTIPLIDCGELENCIKTKRQYLLASLFEAEAKSHAYHLSA